MKTTTTRKMSKSARMNVMRILVGIILGIIFLVMHSLRVNEGLYSLEFWNNNTILKLFSMVISEWLTLISGAYLIVLAIWDQFISEWVQ